MTLFPFRITSRLFKTMPLSTNSTKPTVLLTRRLPPKAQSLLESDPRINLLKWEEERPIPRDHLLSTLKAKPINGILCLLTEKIDAELLDTAGPDLKVVSTMSVGYDHISVKDCQKRNVVVGNTPGVLTSATADLTLSLILMVTRRLSEGLQISRSGEWGDWSPLFCCGSSLEGKTIGMVGLGRIGQAVCKRLKAFDVGSIVYSGPNRKVEAEEAFDAKYVPFEELLKVSDIIVITCSLNDSTRKLFNKKAFEHTKPSAILINTARGSIVDTDALIEALKTGKLGYAGLDVTDPEPLSKDSELFGMKNVTILPHLGSATIETREAMANLAVMNVLKGVLGEELVHRVV